MPWCKYLVSTWPPQWKPSGSDESSVEPLQIYHMRSSPPLFPQLCMSLRPARRWKTEGSTLWVSNMLSYALTPDLNRLFIFCSCQSAVAASVSDSVTAFHEKLFHTDPDELPEKYERSCSRLLCCCILAFLLNWVVLQFVIKSTCNKSSFRTDMSSVLLSFASNSDKKCFKKLSLPSFRT